MNKVVVSLFVFLFIASILSFNVPNIKADNFQQNNVFTSSNTFAPSALPQAADWNKTYGLDNRDEIATSLVNTTDGGFALAGYATTYNSSGIASQVFWLVKTDSLGNMQWNKLYDVGGVRVRAYQVIQASDGGFAIVGFSSNDTGLSTGVDVKVVKTDSLGNQLWNKGYDLGGGNDYGYSIVQSSDGGFLVVGATNSFGTGDYDVLILKLASSGVGQWAKATGRISSDGVSDDYGYSVAKTTDGGYIIAGNSNATKADGVDVYLLKTDFNGTTQWGHLFGGTGYDSGYWVIQSTDGGYVVAGESSNATGTSDMYLLKVNSNGLQLWSKTYGGIDDDWANCVVQSSDGGYALAGVTDSFGAGSDDVYLVKTDSSGVQLWSRTFGGPDSDAGYALVQTSDGGYALAGKQTSVTTYWHFWLIKTLPQYQITFGETGITSSFNDTVLTVDSINYKLVDMPLTFNWSQGSTHAFNYASIATVSTSERCQWNWTSGIPSNSQSGTIFVSADGTISASYQKQYQLVISSAYGSVSGAGWYNASSSAIISVSSPISGGTGIQYVFTGWTGSGAGSYNGSSISQSVTLNNSILETANWQTQFQVSFVDNPSTGGTTNPTGANMWQNAGAISISASPSSGYTFSSWTSTGSITISQASSSSSVATLNGPGSITANFDLIPKVSLVVTSVHGSPTPSGSSVFDSGSQVTCSVSSPVSENGLTWVCSGWTGTGSVPSSGSGTSFVFSISQNSTLTWNWEASSPQTPGITPTSTSTPTTTLTPTPSPTPSHNPENSSIICIVDGQGTTGVAIRVHGNISPAIAGANISITLTDYSGFTTVLTTLTDASGSYEAFYVPQKAENIYASATWTGDASHVGAQSDVVPIKVSAQSSNESSGTLIFVVIGITAAVVVVIVAIFVRRRDKVKKTTQGTAIDRLPVERHLTGELGGRVVTGFNVLDKLLYGGLPDRFSVVLASTSCDERDALVKSFLETGARNGEVVFCVMTNPGFATALAEQFPLNFYLFICNPHVDAAVGTSPNVFVLNGVENLTNISMSLKKTIDNLKPTGKKSRRIVIGLVSDAVLFNGAVQTRKWLAELLPELKSAGFTTLAVIDPKMHAEEDLYRILSVFDGEIDIRERQMKKLERFLKISRMSNHEYARDETVLSEK